MTAGEEVAAVAEPAGGARAARPRVARRAAFALVAAVALVGLIRVAMIVAMEPWGTPAPGSVWTRGPMRSLVGAFHVHSAFSHDGGGSVGDVRRAARDAGLGFVVVTDHNDLRAHPEATPAWPAVVVGEEVSTTGGHVVALGVTEEVRWRRSKDPLSLEDAIAEVERQAGLSIVAHPTHPKSPWDRSARDRVRAIEIYNADEDWRDDGLLDILGSLMTYPVAPVRSLALLLDRPSRALALWDSLLAERDVVGVGACDAHARLDLPGGARFAFPGYWEAFCLVSTEVWPYWRAPGVDSALAPGRDPRLAVLSGIEAGRANVVFRALGTARDFVFQFRGGGRMAWGGGRGVLSGPLRHSLLVLAPGGKRTVVRILKDGRLWRQGPGPVLDEPVTEPGVYRCEVYQVRRLPPFFRRKEFPWVFSNAIRVERDDAVGAPPARVEGS
jgi:hypothetical protein